MTRALMVGRIIPDDLAWLTHDDPRGAANDARMREQMRLDAATVTAALTSRFGPGSDIHQALALIPEGATA